jgi:F420-dependent oxidoreductase-like protein
VTGLPIGVHVTASDGPGLIEGIAAAERAGLQTAWLTVGGVAPDPFAVCAAAAARTERIELGTSIVPTFPRHPLAMAQGALVVDQLAPGRLRLGIGPSHKPAVEGTWGIPFRRPLAHLREYLQILRALLAEGRVDFDGELLSAHASLAAPAPVRLLCSALRPRAFRLAGELADGAISWMCPPPYLRDVARPALEAGAKQAGRPTPPLVAHVPVVACRDWERARAAAQRRFAINARLPYYARMLQDAGFPEAASGEPSEGIIRALLVSGTDQQIADRIAELRAFGADEVLASPVALLDDPAPTQARTVALLGELARASGERV